MDLQTWLLTGSKASGKSTFLRTLALNCILAQTLHTAPVLSSMAIQDSLVAGESCFVAEVESLRSFGAVLWQTLL